MKLSIKKITILLGMLSIWLHFLPGLSAQSLDALLSLAREQNLTLHALEQEYKSALQKVPQTRLLPATEIGVGGFAMPVQTRVGPQRMRLGLMQSFPWFGTLDAQEELSRAAAEPLANKVEIEALDIFYKIKLAYFHLYELQETIKILTQNIALLESLRTLSLNKIEGGKASTADVLRLEIKLRELRQQIQILKQQILQPQIDINQLLNRDTNIEINATGPLLFASFLTPTDSLPQQLSPQHPALTYIKNQQTLAQSAIALNEKKGKPRLGFGADYIMVEGIPTADLVGNGRDILQFKASLNIPLQRKPYEAKKQEELLKIEALEQRKEAMEDQFIASIQKSLAAYNEAKLKYELYQQQIESTRAVIQIIQSDYSHNGKQFGELIQLDRDLLDYEIELLHAIVESHKAQAAIERFIF